MTVEQEGALDQRGPCPECGGEVDAYFTCHTYPGGTRDDGSVQWYVCSSCDSAYEFFCLEDDCDWHYTWGLNPKNPRSEANEQHRPDWLKGQCPL